MTTTKRDLGLLAAIFLGIAMAEPTLEKQAEPLPGAGEKTNLAFYEIFGNLDNQEGVSDERTSQNEQ